jgi:hypothetical protein
MHLNVHITNENSETVIYIDHPSPVTVKSSWPCRKDMKKKVYTGNFGGEISWAKTIWKTEDDTQINIRETVCEDGGQRYLAQDYV